MPLPLCLSLLSLSHSLSRSLNLFPTPLLTSAIRHILNNISHFPKLARPKAIKPPKTCLIFFCFFFFTQNTNILLSKDHNTILFFTTRGSAHLDFRAMFDRSEPPVHTLAAWLKVSGTLLFQIFLFRFPKRLNRYRPWTVQTKSFLCYPSYNSIMDERIQVSRHILVDQVEFFLIWGWGGGGGGGGVNGLT